MRLTSRIAFLLREAALSAILLAGALTAGAANAPGADRPSYRISLAVDYDLLTFTATAEVQVPASPGDPLRDVVLFVYANSGGIGGEDERRRNVVVESVRLGPAALPFTMEGPVLKARLPELKSSPFTIQVAYRGVVPRGQAGGADLTSGLGMDLGALFGGGSPGSTAQSPRPKNSDFGLYSYANGVLSLGAFWYPQVAVRRGGAWMDRAPEGLGDVAYAEMSDFDVEIALPARVRVAAAGAETQPSRAGLRRWVATGVRDFAVLMSEDFLVKSRAVDVGGRRVSVESFNTRGTAAQADRSLDIAAYALQAFSRRFGTYPYESFRVVEGPIRGGAGGMEFSGLTSIASMAYQDWSKSLAQLTGSLGLGDLDKVLGALGQAAGTAGASRSPAEQSAGGLLAGIIGQPGEALDTLLEMTIAHEAAHQWWAIRVGSDSVRAPFVDESLANYTAILYFEDRYGRERAAKMLDLHVRTPYRTGRLLGVPDAAANLPTASYRGNLQYGAVVYGKGALFYDALRRAVGDPVFFAALREYSDTYANKLAGPRALLDIMRARAPAAGVDALYRRWIEEAHGDEDIGGGAPMGFEELLRKALSPEGR
jgi:hypothetical protein